MKSISFNKIKQDVKKYISLGKALKKDKKIPIISKILLALAIGY